MTEPAQLPAITLEEVRNRFLEAEGQLEQAASSLDQLRTAINAVGEAREEVVEVAGQLTKAVEHLEAMIGLHQESLKLMQAGIDALKETEPAEVLRQLSATQNVIVRAHGETTERIRDLGNKLRDDLGGQAQKHFDRQMERQNETFRLLGHAESSIHAHLGSIEENTATSNREVMTELASTKETIAGDIGRSSAAVEKHLREMQKSLPQHRDELSAQVRSARVESRVTMLVLVLLVISGALAIAFRT